MNLCCFKVKYMLYKTMMCCDEDVKHDDVHDDDVL